MPCPTVNQSFKRLYLRLSSIPGFKTKMIVQCGNALTFVDRVISKSFAAIVQWECIISRLGQTIRCIKGRIRFLTYWLGCFVS